MNSYALAAFSLLSFACLMTTAALPDEPETFFPNPHSGYKAKQEFSKILKTATSDDLDELAVGSSVSLGLRAAWERVLRDSRQTNNQSNERSRFLGFVEGRLLCSIPKWWSSAVIEAEILPNQQNFPEINYTAPFPQVVTDGGFRRVTAGIETWDLQDRSAVFMVTHEMLKEWGPADIVVVKFHGDKIFLAIADDRCSCYKIGCFSTIDQSKIWDSQVRAAQTWLASSGIGGGQRISFAIRGERVFVFGGGEASLYMETFRVDDGQVIVRFCTTI